MTRDMRIVLDGQTLPKYSSINVDYQSREATNETLGGNIFTFYKNNRRTWTITWENMLYENYVAVRQIYLNEFLNRRYPYLQFPAENVYAPVHLSIDKAQLQLNGTIIPSFTLTLQEQNAIS